MNQDRSPDLDRLWSGVPVGSPDLAGAVRRGDRARRTRQTSGAVTASAVLVAVTVAGTSLWPGSTPAPAPGVAAEGTTLYYLLPEPVPEGEPLGRRASLLTPRQVQVADTGDPAYDALHHLMSTEAPESLLSAVMQPETANRLTIDVVDVTHREGRVTVELTRDPYDPCPVCSLVLTFRGESVAQAWAMTAQDALGTDDPVSFVADGQTVEGVWGARIDDPVVTDRDLVLPSDDPLDLPTEPESESDGPSMAAEVVGRVGLDGSGCVTLDGEASVWPHGWTAWEVEGRLVLLDERGAIAAREGDRIEGGGGYTHFHGAGRCAPDGEIAHVQTDVVVTSSD